MRQALNKLGDTPVDIWYKSGMITSPEVGFYFVRDEDSASLGASEFRLCPGASRPQNLCARVSWTFYSLASSLH